MIVTNDTQGIMHSIYREIQHREKLQDHHFRIDFLTVKNIEFRIDLTSGATESMGTVYDNIPSTPIIDFDSGAISYSDLEYDNGEDHDEEEQDD